MNFPLAGADVLPFVVTGKTEGIDSEQFWHCAQNLFRIFGFVGGRESLHLLQASEFFLGVAKLVVQTVAQTWIVDLRIFVSRCLPKTFGNAFSRVHLTQMPKNSTYQHALSTERIQFVSMLVIWNAVLKQIPVIPGNSLYPLTGGSG